MYAPDALGLLTILLSDSNEQSMTAGAINRPPTFTYDWIPHHDVPMSLPTIKSDFAYVLTKLHSYPYEDLIPIPGLLIDINPSRDLWAIQGPFTYEVAAWYARAMLMYFEQRGNPHCALVLSISQRGSEVGRVEVRPRLDPGQGATNATSSETVDTTKKY